MYGAAVIWDFDDEHILKFWIEGAAPPGAPSIHEGLPGKEMEVINVLEPEGHSWPTYNPYPSLGAPTLPSWPRGLPLVDINEPETYTTKLSAASVHRE